MNKVGRAEQGELALFAVRSAARIEGVMAIQIQPRPARIESNRFLIYVDYTESAHWNIRVADRNPEHSGVGTVLIEEAVRVSLQRGLDGRIGLHSLSQAERFYEVHCRMTPAGPDPSYLDLAYFEYTGSQGAVWLSEEK